MTKIPDIVASLDAEWVNARNADVSMPATDNRLLSYQLTIMNRITGKTWSVIIEPKDGSKRGRLGLGNLLGRALRRALQAGVIAEFPDKITLVAHFSRADLTHLRDWKYVGSQVDAVRRTFTTASRPFTHVVPTPRGPKRISIMLTDTMLLAPAKMKSLERLGAALRLTKVALPPGYSKDCMDLFKQGAPEAFADYAIMDTIIAARWAVRVWGLGSVVDRIRCCRSRPHTGFSGGANDRRFDDTSRAVSGCLFWLREDQTSATAARMPDRSMGVLGKHLSWRAQ